MKHGYEGVNPEDLIKNYIIEDGFLTIYHLDGSFYKVAFTKETEKKLLEEMKLQATVRNNSSAMRDAKYKQKRWLVYCLLNILIGAINAGAYINSKTDDLMKIVGVIGVTCAGCGAFLNALLIIFKNSEINELEKYRLFIGIYDEFEMNKYASNTFNGVSNKHGTKLNFNTLDDYSLKEIQKVKTNLKIK